MNAILFFCVTFAAKKMIVAYRQWHINDTKCFELRN